MFLRLFPLAIAFVLLGLGLGALLALGLAWLRRGRARVRSLGRPAELDLPGLPSPWGRAQCWEVEGIDEAWSMAPPLARWLAGARPVLVLAPAQHRERLQAALAGAPGVFWTDRTEPDAGAALAACERLRWGGGAALLVLGLESLAEPQPHEHAAVVLGELIADRPDDLTLLAVVPPGTVATPEPNLRVSQVELLATLSSLTG